MMARGAADRNRGNAGICRTKKWKDRSETGDEIRVGDLKKRKVGLLAGRDAVGSIIIQYD